MKIGIPQIIVNAQLSWLCEFEELYDCTASSMSKACIVLSAVKGNKILTMYVKQFNQKTNRTKKSLKNKYVNSQIKINIMYDNKQQPLNSNFDAPVFGQALQNNTKISEFNMLRFVECSIEA